MKSKKLTKPGIRKVLFVCNGNVFRSFSAESLLKHYLNKHNIKGWDVFSAGTIAKPQKIDPEVIADLKTFGIKNFRHHAYKLNKPLLKKYDLVIAMAEDQVDFMKKNFNYKHAILFNELVKDKKISIWDIEDDVKDYATNRNEVEKKIDKTIQYIHDSIPKLIESINERVYLFEDFAKGLKKREHRNGFPVIRLYETSNTLAFMSINIPSKEDGHILVIPKKRYIYFHEIPPNILKELLIVVQKIGAVIENDHGGYNILLNNGRAAGQYIFHAHFHLFPRDSKDKIKLEGWTNKRMTIQQFIILNKKLKQKIVNQK
jgi:histidine triad (HIT) family protein